MAKFKIGDRVRVTSRVVAADFNSEFRVTAIHEAPKGLPRGDYWYSGDPRNHGVWENFLEIVEAAS